MSDHEGDIHQPESEPHGRDGQKPDREEDHAGGQEQQDASEQPNAIPFARISNPLSIIDPVSERGAVIIK